MTIRFSRESSLVIFALLTVLVGLFYLGNYHFVQPAKEEALRLNELVEINETLLKDYPPSEELLEEYKTSSHTTRLFLPIGAQANTALITLEKLANDYGVELLSVERKSALEAVEGVPAEFVKNSYSVEIGGESPASFRQLIRNLMKEERVWNVNSFSYSKDEEGSFKGHFSVDIYFFKAGDDDILD